MAYWYISTCVPLYYTLLKNKRKVYSYVRKLRRIGCKVIYDQRTPHMTNIGAFLYILGGASSYTNLHLIPSEFLNMRKIFFSFLTVYFFLKRQRFHIVQDFYEPHKLYAQEYNEKLPLGWRRSLSGPPGPRRSIPPSSCRTGSGCPTSAPKIRILKITIKIYAS